MHGGLNAWWIKCMVDKMHGGLNASPSKLNFHGQVKVTLALKRSPPTQYCRPSQALENSA